MILVNSHCRPICTDVSFALFSNLIVLTHQSLFPFSLFAPFHAVQSSLHSSAIHHHYADAIRLFYHLLQQICIRSPSIQHLGVISNFISLNLGLPQKLLKLSYVTLTLSSISKTYSIHSLKTGQPLISVVLLLLSLSTMISYHTQPLCM